MTVHEPRTKEEYIHQLTAALKKQGTKDINDILIDYQDYFAQSKAKGYSDTESIRLLPSVQELAASYDEKYNDSIAEQTRAAKSQPSSRQKLTLFGMTLAGDILLLPALCMAVLLLACFGIVGFFLMLTGPLLFIPDSMLGQMDVARMPFLQVLPTALLFIAAGLAIMGACIAMCERIYSTYRASIVVRRWLLNGRHDNHIRLVPGVSKRLRTSLYRITLISGIAAAAMLLILGCISLFSEGTINFPSTWNM